MDKPYFATAEVAVLPSRVPIPGLGFLPVNAFLILAEEPVLVDTGMGIDREEFMKALESLIDPGDLRWVWITHDDADHVGSFDSVVEAAPKARIAANAVSLLRMGTTLMVPMDRIFCLNCGESISAGDRTLTAFSPPLFDNPATIGFRDDKTGSLFSADLFGAVLPSPVRDLEEVPEEALAQGQVLWGTIDSPWIHFTDRADFHRKLDAIGRMAPEMIFSSHLPPARGRTEQFLESLAAVPEAEPFVAPNQAALEQILAQTGTQ